MDKHQQALSKLIRNLVALDPVCSVVAIGSVGRGDYGPESDMDINVITWRHKEIPKALSWEYSQCFVDWPEVRLDEGYVDGIKTHLNCSTPVNYQAGVMGGPAWRWGASKVLHDPSGIAAWGEACIRRFFDDNPSIAERCREAHEEYRRHKRDKDAPSRFRTEHEFIRSLDLSKVAIGYRSFGAAVLERSNILPS